uniref:MICOS complex subunit MIC13 n=1 Tax=Tetraodon nigroviridis TaxID=99883 RepID=H3CZ66_TETNG
MAARILPVLKLATKVTIAGGALYVACDSGLLGSGEQGSQALGRAKAAIPPAVEEWMKYFGLESPTAILSPQTQLPTVPTVEFSPVQTWNSGVRWTVSALSEAPTKANEYTHQCIHYLKDLTK